MRRRSRGNMFRRALPLASAALAARRHEAGLAHASRGLLYGTGSDPYASTSGNLLVSALPQAGAAHARGWKRS